MEYYTYPSLPSFVKQTCGETAVNIYNKISNTLFQSKQYKSSIDFAFDLTNVLRENGEHKAADIVSIWNERLDEIVTTNDNRIMVTYKDCIVT